MATPLQFVEGEREGLFCAQLMKEIDSFHEGKNLFLEGSSFIGKTTLMKKLQNSGASLHHTDFIDKLKLIDDPNMKDCFLKYTSDPLCCLFYMTSEVKFYTKIITEARENGGVNLFDRSLLSNMVYGPLLRIMNNRPCFPVLSFQEIFQLFVNCWESMNATNLIKLQWSSIHRMDQILIGVSGKDFRNEVWDTTKVGHRSSKHDQECEHVFGNYRALNDLCWSFVGKELGCHVIMTRGGYLSETLADLVQSGVSIFKPEELRRRESEEIHEFIKKIYF